MNNFGIYIHIPFCEHKCKYCKFISCVCDENSHKLYFTNLQNQIKSTKIPKQITSIYFGGGTPSCVSSTLICDTLNLIYKQFNVSKTAEISIECNPNLVNLQKLMEYKKTGFNRISFGAQSFEDLTLQKLGRLHNSQQIFEAIKLAKQAGFNNINLDLMLGVDEIDQNSFENSIKKVKNLGVTHISMYMLILENGTKLHTEVKNKTTIILSDEKSVNQYEKFRKVLKNYGYNRYEISNFALKNYECKHNINYWFGGEYFGFGTSAHSYFLGKRFFVDNNIDKFLNNNFTPSKIFKNIKKVSKKQKIEEYIMLSLRTKYGINLKYLKNILDYDIINKKAKEIKYLQKNKAIILTKNSLKISSKFFGVSNQIILKLI